MKDRKRGKEIRGDEGGYEEREDKIYRVGTQDI